ncbi:hypothetical protein MBLNU459_g3829t1 [Dothideomycetes sp. NU459]
MTPNQKQRPASEAAGHADLKHPAKSANKPANKPATDTSVPGGHDRRKESSKLSQQALAAQKKAQELRKAANGAADPDERQHLMEEAINTQIEAESFGKTAKYLQSGTFQGMVVGTGIGTAPGLTLGTLTGTLVGGTTSLITGGLGGAIGAATGALHGPFWDMGKLAGKGIRKITGDGPGWKATTEQKAALEKMIGQVNEQDPPNETDLKDMAEWDTQTGDNQQKQTWTEYGASYMPSISAGQGPKPKENDRAASQDKQKKAQAATRSDIEPDHTKLSPGRTAGQDHSLRQTSQASTSAQSHTSRGNTTDATPNLRPQPTANSQQICASSNSHKRPRKIQQQQQSTTKSQQTSSSQDRKTPRKLEVRKSVAPTPQTRKSPRKLEVRKQDVSCQ